MRKPNNPDRVRPVPLDDDPQAPAAPMPDGEASRTRSVAVPLTLIAGALALVVVAVIGFGAVEDPEATVDIAEPTDFSSTANDGSPEGQLLVSAAAEDARWSVVWDSSPDPFSIGSIGAIPAPSEVSTNPPLLDADGVFLATNQCIGDRCGVSIVRSDDPSEPLAFVEAESYVWHSEEPGRLAWITTPGGLVRTARVDDGTEQLVDPGGIRAPGDGLRLVRWDKHGFVLTANITMAVDNEGQTRWSDNGRLLDVDSSLATVAREGEWAVVDRQDGSDIVVAAPDDGLLTVVNAKAGNVRSETTESGYTYTLDVLQPVSARPQTSAQDLRTLPIGTQDGAEYRIYRGTDDGSITIVFEEPEPLSPSADG